eukprot:1682487-Amphidinium_carterae.1
MCASVALVLRIWHVQSLDAVQWQGETRHGGHKPCCPGCTYVSSSGACSLGYASMTHHHHHHHHHHHPRRRRRRHHNHSSSMTHHQGLNIDVVDDDDDNDDDGDDDADDDFDCDGDHHLHHRHHCKITPGAVDTASAPVQLQRSSKFFCKASYRSQKQLHSR